jgi:hypothetical protein
MINLLEVLDVVIASTALVALCYRVLGERREAAYFTTLTIGFAIAAGAIHWLVVV